MSTNLTVTKKSALDRIQSAVEKPSVEDLVRSRTRRSLLVLDCSSSMGQGVSDLGLGPRRIDRLRAVVKDLLATHRVPMCAFGPFGPRVELVEAVPEPGGMTPLHRAIAFGHEQGANHLVVVTDGEPDRDAACYDAAKLLGGPIDVFFVGDRENEQAIAFGRELARRTGGQFHLSDLAGSTKELTTKIAGLLGDGGR